ncbi:MAG: hypothetical protein ABI551_19060, partial [Polyangiaceae bacterium]
MTHHSVQQCLQSLQRDVQCSATCNRCTPASSLFEWRGSHARCAWRDSWIDVRHPAHRVQSRHPRSRSKRDLMGKIIGIDLG